MALVARVVATTNRPTPETFSLRPTVTLYRVHVKNFGGRNRSWCVLRRYSEFAELHEALASAFRAEMALPQLPPKLVFNTTAALAERYLELDAFLRSILSMPSVSAHPRLRSFLGADGITAPPSAPARMQQGGASPYDAAAGAFVHSLVCM